MTDEIRRERVVETSDTPDDTPTTVVERQRTRVDPVYVPPAQPAVVEPTVYRPLGHQVNRVIWYLFGLLEGLLALRFVLRALAANPDNAFAAFIYAVTGPFVLPFKTLVREPRADGAVFEITTLVAMAVYLLLAYAITKLIHILSDRTYV